MVVFAYGMFSYFLFFGTFLYLIGFTGNLYVPKGVDGGPQASMVEALVVNFLLIFAFAVQHTIMARPAFKQWWTRVIPKAAERSTFVLIASCILLLMYWQWRPMTTVVWSLEQPLAKAVMWTLFAWGFGLVLFSTFLIDHFDLFGLRQVWLHLRGREYTAVRFQERSVYKRIRHPLMLGFMIAFWSTPTMTLGHLYFALVFTGYIFVGIMFEERDLIKAHGRAYMDYMKRTGALLPKFRTAPQGDFAVHESADA